jgi:hypothetical protein
MILFRLFANSGKFVTGIKDTSGTSGKFTAGVIVSCGKFATAVVDTRDAS